MNTLPITRFRGKHFFLSNFYPVLIKHDNLYWYSVESAYMAMKTTDASERQRMAWLTARQAKQKGRQIKLRTDWNDVRLDIMRELLQRKFSIPTLKRKLLATGQCHIQENNTWGDRYWGVCDGRGENNLGKLLMEIRSMC